MRRAGSGGGVSDPAARLAETELHRLPVGEAEAQNGLFEIVDGIDQTSAGGVDLVSSTGHGNVSWSKIDSEIKNDHPVIVYIKKSNGRGGHYVVITGKDSKDYIVHDPYFGSNLYLGTSRALVGKLGIDSKTVVDQMIIYH